MKDEHLPVFDCAFAPPQGGRSIHFRGHLRMMAAVQPFLSGAISKTCNVPNEATVEEIRNAYLEGWKLGLKALAIYRDGSKGSQPLSTKSESGDGPVPRSRGIAASASSSEAPRRRARPSRQRRVPVSGRSSRQPNSQSTPSRAAAAYPPKPDAQVRHSGS